MAADPSLAAGAADANAGAASMSPLPPLNLSTGPAIAGGPTTGGNAMSGAFTYTRDGTKGGFSTLAQSLPMALALVAAAWFISRK